MPRWLPDVPFLLSVSCSVFSVIHTLFNYDLYKLLQIADCVFRQSGCLFNIAYKVRHYFRKNEEKADKNLFFRVRVGGDFVLFCA